MTPTRWRTWLPVAVATTAILLVTHLVDLWAFTHLANPRVAERDWGRLFRIVGFLPTWLAIAMAVALEDGGRRLRVARWFQTRAARLAMAATAGGALAEILKLLVRRERPRAHGGAYAFRSFLEKPLSTSGLGFPSSHTAVAFGGAFLFARLFPRARWVGFTLAVGCGYTRLAAEAHFLSDVAGGALAGYVGAWLTDRLLVRSPPPNQQPRA